MTTLRLIAAIVPAAMLGLWTFLGDHESVLPTVAFGFALVAVLAAAVGQVADYRRRHQTRPGEGWKG